MKATVIRQFGGPDVLVHEDVETPAPRPGHVRIKILAAGVNRFDHYIREGSVTSDLPFPHILGADAAGQIAELGEGVRGFEVGERVVPLTGYPTNETDAHIYPISAAQSYTVTGFGTCGTYAQYIDVPARWVLKDDTGLSPELVATLPMVATTAVRAVREVGGVQSGQKVLVTGAASGVGRFEL